MHASLLKYNHRVSIPSEKMMCVCEKMIEFFFYNSQSVSQSICFLKIIIIIFIDYHSITDFHSFKIELNIF